LGHAASIASALFFKTVLESRRGDITATARDGSQRFLKQYRAIEYSMPRGCAAGYMPEMNVLIAASDYSSQSNQPLMKNIKVRVAPSTAE